MKVAPARTVHSYGCCEDCDGNIDTIVAAYQVVGNDKLICAECCGKRIIKGAKNKAARMLEKAEQARDDQRQGTINFE